MEVEVAQPIHVNDRLAASVIMGSTANATVADSFSRSNLTAHF